VRYTAQDAGGTERIVQVPVYVDPVDELNSKVRSVLHDVAAAKQAGDFQPESFQPTIANLDVQWRTLQQRVQSIFMLLAIVKKQSAA